MSKNLEESFAVLPETDDSPSTTNPPVLGDYDIEVTIEKVRDVLGGKEGTLEALKALKQNEAYQDCFLHYTTRESMSPSPPSPG